MRSFTPCVLIILASTWGCNQTACIDDPKFRAEFQNCMTFASMIARGEYGLEGFDSEQESKLIGSLEALTKHKSKIKLRSEEHTSELQSRLHLVCRLLLEKK